MQRTKKTCHSPLLSLLILPLAACSPQPPANPPTVESSPTIEAGIPTPSPQAAAAAAAETPMQSPTAAETQANIPEIEVPDPDPGTANVVGRIFWNEQPVTGISLLMCETIDLAEGCLGAAFESQTDENGVYLFANVAPGEYDLVVESLDFEHWLYVTAGPQSGAEKHRIAADATLRLPDFHIFNFDLAMTSPAEDEAVSAARPALAWEAYPSASYYRVFLQEENGTVILQGEKTELATIAPTVDLKACTYLWQVEAYNAADIKIAEHDGYARFQVVDQPQSC
ncbi:MAG: hypothetical protein JW929_04485 [Anaerolineales bacterium]|nr:hypothetical protein [Anaerolineales bacterium]